MSRTVTFLLGTLGAWAELARRSPLWTSAIGMALVLVTFLAAGQMVRGWLEQRSNRVAAGPIFALSGIGTFGLALLIWLLDATFAAFGEPHLAHRFALMLAEESKVRAILGIPDGPIALPGPAALPLAIVLLAIVYLVFVTWAGRTLAEMTSLEQKPDDVLANERAEHQKAIATALKEGRTLPQAEVVSIPLSDDLFGRTYKLLGHWTTVELVEDRFLRWQKPLVLGLLFSLGLALPAAVGGHLHVALWAGALVFRDGLWKNLRTPPKPKEEEKPIEEAKPTTLELPSVRPMIEAVHKDAGPLTLAPTEPTARPAQISPGTELASKRVLEDMLRELGMKAGLYVHQGLACDAFAQRRNVLLTTPPLSGKRTLLDLLIFYTLLVDSETVLYLAPDAEEARLAEERFRKRATDAKWQWNIHAARIAGSAGAVDPGRAQPGLVFADPESLHRDLCGKQGDWAAYLGALGLVVVPDLERYHGTRGAHLAHLLRRLRRAAFRASPVLPPQSTGERLRFVATATPLFRDLGRFAERVIGRPFLVLGPEVDGAPQPDGVAYLLPARTASSDLHPAVHALGEALATGLSAELFGYDDTLSLSDVTAANEIMIRRGVATRGRSFADPNAVTSDALTSAHVVVARASAARFAVLPMLLSHVGHKVGRVPKAKHAALGKGETVGAGAARKEEPPKEIVPGEIQRADDFVLTAEQLAAANLEQKIVHFLQPDLEPFAALLVKERPHPSHADLRHGCTLVVDPTATSVQSVHLTAALAEAELTEEELASDFSPALVQKTLEKLRASTSARVVTRDRRSIDSATGEARIERTHRVSGANVPELAIRAAGDATRVVDRHTGDVILAVERPRALAAAYPGRILVRQKKRFSVLPLENQDSVDSGRIVCEREERALTTSRMRRIQIEIEERRTTAERRTEERKTAGRRASAPRTLGGAPFSLRHLPVHVREEVVGFRRFDPNGLVRDMTLYPEPIVCDLSSRAAVLGFPKQSFGEVGTASLHALAHLFRTTLPAFLHHGEEDVEVAWIQRFGDRISEENAPEKQENAAELDTEPSIVFVDAHPSGVGFADAITLDVLRACVRWSLALIRRCPGGCSRQSGCLFCLQIRDCHAEPERIAHLDKFGADAVLASLLGEAEATRLGPPPKAP